MPYKRIPFPPVLMLPTSKQAEGSLQNKRREEKHMNEERDLKLFEIMDDLDVDMDTAELLLEDMEEVNERED